MYSLVGMELFAYKVAFDNDNKLDLVNGIVPNANFNTFYYAFITVFTLLTNSGWSKVLFNNYRAVGASSSLIYSISFVFLGEMIMFNLFIAILL